MGLILEALQERDRLRLLGVPLPDPAEPEWRIDPAHRRTLTERLETLVRAHDEEPAGTPELTQSRIREALDLPDVRVLDLLTSPRLTERHDRIVLAGAALPATLRPAADIACQELTTTGPRADGSALARTRHQRSGVARPDTARRTRTTGPGCLSHAGRGGPSPYCAGWTRRSG